MVWSLTIHGHTIHFFIDSLAVQGSADLEGRRNRVEACLNLLPPEHIRLIVEPIIVVDRFPRGRRRGGGWFPPASAGGNATVELWLDATGEGNTLVSASQIRARLGGTTDTGIIGITSAAFLLDENWGGGHKAHEYTVLHEVGHSVDFHSGLIPPRRLSGRYGNAAYQGQRYEGGSVGELAAEAYSRFFLRPNTMCRGGNGTPPCIQPDGTPAVGGCPNQRRCSGRHQRDLQNTPAFGMTSVVFPLASAEWDNLTPDGAHRFASMVGERRGPLNGHNDAYAALEGSPYGAWRGRGPLRESVA
jgi:hypothetical protein